AHTRAGLRPLRTPVRRGCRHRRGHSHAARSPIRMKAGRLHPRSVLVVAGACFVALAASAMLLGAVSADTALREAILRLASPRTLNVMRIVNRAGDWRALAPGLAVLLLVFAEARRQWW